MILGKARTLLGDFPTVSRFVGDGLWALLSRLSISVLGLAIGAFLTRILPPMEVGEFTFILSLVAPAAILARLGLGVTAVREVASAIARSDLQQARETVLQILIWSVIGLIVTIVLFSLFSGSLGVRSELLLLSSLWIIVITGNFLLGDLMRGFHDIRASVLISGSNYGGIISHIVTVGLLGLVLLSGGQFSINQIITLVLFGGASAMGIGLLYLWKAMPEPGKSTTRLPHVLDFGMLAMSLPVLVSMITDILWSQSAIWILSAQTTAEDVALYDSARRLVLLVGMTLTIVNVVLPPMVAQLYTEGRFDALERLLRRSALLVSVPGILGLIIIAFFGEAILGIVYGDFYREGAMIFLILAVGNTFQVLTGSCGVVLNMTGKQSELMYVMLVTSLFFVVTASFVAPQWGHVGVAAVMSAGLIVQNIAKMILVKRLVGIWTFAGI